MNFKQKLMIPAPPPVPTCPGVADCKLVSIMLLNACRHQTNSPLFDFGARLIRKLCHTVASHFFPQDLLNSLSRFSVRDPQHIAGTGLECTDKRTASKHSARCASCEIKLAGTFHRWMQLVCFLNFYYLLTSSDPLGFLAEGTTCKRFPVDVTNIFQTIGRTGGPSCGVMGRSVEALSSKRLSVTNFASGWMPLIYVGEDWQRAAVSPEMPRRVNCILLLVTHTPAFPSWGSKCAKPFSTSAHPSLRRPSSREARAKFVNEVWFLPPSYRCVRVDRRNEWMIEQCGNKWHRNSPFLPPAPPRLQRSLPLMFTSGDWDVTSFILCDNRKRATSLNTGAGDLEITSLDCLGIIESPNWSENKHHVTSLKSDLCWRAILSVKKRVLWMCLDVYTAWSHHVLPCMMMMMFECNNGNNESISIQHHFHQEIEGVFKII